MEIWQAQGSIRSIADIEALEHVPLNQRFKSWDVNDWLNSGLSRFPDKRALTYFPHGDCFSKPSHVDYAELRRRVLRTANLLASLGVGRNDSVAVLLPLVPEANVVLLAALATGIVFPINWMLSAEAVGQLIGRARPKVVITLGPTPEFRIWETVRDVLDTMPSTPKLFSVSGPGTPLCPDYDLESAADTFPSDRLSRPHTSGREDIVAYIHSGGTTGIPKIVKLTSGGIVHKCWTVTMCMDYRTTDVIISDMPTFHVAGFIGCVLLPTLLGNSLIIPSIHGARDRAYIANFWKFVERHRPSFVHAVPATLSMLAHNPASDEDISSLRDYSTTGSTGLPIEVATAFEKNTGIRILATYGATEFTMNVTQAPRNGETRYGSAGIRNPDTQVKIVQLDKNGNIRRVCKAQESGVIIVKSPGTTPGYLGTPDDPTVFLGDGWINNGDLGRLDEDGYLWITGRAKDLIIRSGHNIDPNIIEVALYRHPAVFMAAAVGKPDAYAGELPIAYVQLKSGASVSGDELRTFIQRLISDPVAVPREIIVLDEMPLTDVRKVAKSVLRRSIAKETFEQQLHQQLPDAVIDLRIDDDPQHGELVRILLFDLDAQAEDAVARVMRKFSVAYRIENSRPNS
jgi:fatty-acyl-CoA synthase